MPPLSKENFVQVMTEDLLNRGVRRFIKTGPGQYWYDGQGYFHHKVLITEAKHTGKPLDAGVIESVLYDPEDKKGEIFFQCKNGSVGFEIEADDPERQVTLNDFAEWAQGTRITVR